MPDARLPLATLDDLLAPVLAASPERPFVVAQLGQSLDGRIATVSGESQWINRGAALDHLHRLRASVDAVVVGVGTVAADDPLLNVRRVAGAHPARVVIDPSGRCPPAARCLQPDGARRVLVRAHGVDGVPPAGVEVVSLAVTDGRLDPAEIVTRLFAMGFKRLLVEGGASTVSQFIDRGAVDRLHILVAPLILGSGKLGLQLHPNGRLAEALRPETRVHVLPDGDVLFDCDLRTRAAEPPAP